MEFLESHISEVIQGIFKINTHFAWARPFGT